MSAHLQVRMEDIHFDGSTFADNLFQGAVFIDCYFPKADLRGAFFEGITMQERKKNKWHPECRFRSSAQIVQRMCSECAENVYGDSHCAEYVKPMNESPC